MLCLFCAPQLCLHGNVLLPICLRWILVWGSFKARRNSSRKIYLRYLLINGRSCIARAVANNAFVHPSRYISFICCWCFSIHQDLLFQPLCISAQLAAFSSPVVPAVFPNRNNNWLVAMTFRFSHLRFSSIERGAPFSLLCSFSHLSATAWQSEAFNYMNPAQKMSAVRCDSTN